MNQTFLRRILVVLAMVATVSLTLVSSTFGADKIKLRMAGSGSATDIRAEALGKEFGPAVASFANYEGHWNASLFKQGTELEAIARGNLEMALASAQELAVFIPEFSIFAAGYVHRDADHQLAVFKNPLMDPLKQKVEETLNMKLLSVMYFGRRQVNLRTEKKVMVPGDLAGVNLRMPGTDAWQFLGKALGASPTPVAFSEVYTALQTGAIDGQDNPLPTLVDKKFYEVTKQIILTSHLVDLNYIAISTKVWNKLSAKQQKTVQAAADKTATHARNKQLELEKSLVAFLEKEGLKIYTPNVKAFREKAQKMYLESDYAEVWPKGLLDKINSL